MDTEPKDVIVLGSIRRGKKKFSNIQNETRINPEELNSILEQLENNGLIMIDNLLLNCLRISGEFSS